MSIYVAFESMRYIDSKVKHLQIKWGGECFLKGDMYMLIIRLSLLNLYSRLMFLLTQRHGSFFCLKKSSCAQRSYVKFFVLSLTAAGAIVCAHTFFI